MGFGDWLMGEDPEQYDTEERRRQAELERGDELREDIGRRMGDIDQRQAPGAQRTTVGDVRTGTGARIDPSQQRQIRQGQSRLIGQLGETAAGRGPFQADIAAKRAQEQNLLQQQSLMAGARGGQGAAQARQASRQVSGFGQQVAGQTAQGRLQEQTAARGQLGQLLGQAREQDIGLASGQAQLSQQMNLANLSAQNQQIFQQAQLDQATSLADMDAKLRMTGMNDAAITSYLSQLMGMDAAELQARMQQEELYSQTLDPGRTGALGDILSAGAGIASMFSDVRLKHRVKKASNIKPLTDAISQYSKAYVAKKDKKKKKAPKQDPDKTKDATQSTKKPTMTERRRQRLSRMKKPIPEPGVKDPFFRSPMYSDEKTKKAEKMLKHLKPYEYEYNKKGTDKGMPNGRRHGVMAQDLMKSKAGRDMVVKDTKDGTMMVDYGKAQSLSTMMASLALHNQKITDIEKKLKKKKKGKK